MYGRCGMDKLNFVLLISGFVLMLVMNLLVQYAYYNAHTTLQYIASALQFAAYGLLVWCIIRMFSRNLAARQRETRKFEQFWRKLTDRKNRYYRCPQCRQTVRVPRGRGKICIKCPKCGEKFVRKS